MNWQRLKSVTLIFLLVLVSFQSPAMVWPWKWNQVNRHGDRQGKWRGYFEHKPEQLLFTGRFKKGKEKGIWKTYSPEGHLERQERYYTGQKKIKTTYFHPDGNVSHTGMAYLFEEKGYLRYQWHGDWHYYDSTGVSKGFKSFNRGKDISQRPTVIQQKKSTPAN